MARSVSKSWVAIGRRRFGPTACMVAALLASSLIPACSKPATSSANLAVPSITLDFANGRLLNTARIAEILPEYQITDPETVPAPLIFGSGRIDALNLSEPVILRKIGSSWKFVELPTLNHTDWVYAGASFERNELWAILDSTPESKTPGLYLFRSVDHGQTWKLFSGVKPPTILAEFVEFSMTAAGNGRLIVHQDDDTPETPRGLYAYASSDGGKSWTGPTFTPDDLISADPSPIPSLQDTLQSLDGESTPVPHSAPAPVPPFGRPGRRGPGP